MSSTDDRERELVGYQLHGGEILCVDCDIYPHGAEWICAGDLARSRECCESCQRPLLEVRPIGVKP